MFSFGFSSEKEVEISSNSSKESKSSLQWLQAKEVPFCNFVIVSSFFNYSQNDFNLELANAEDVMNFLKENGQSDALKANAQHSDLLPAVYEGNIYVLGFQYFSLGGLKVWECTSDLLNYLATSNFKQEMEGKTVLDLGCGAGVLGIFALMNGAQRVDFQDYNEEVLKYYTQQNLMINFSNEDVEKRAKFFCGDWESFADLQAEATYDYIFTSETIYNLECYPKIIKVIKSTLKNSGKVFLAAKSHYFGVGGGTRQFESALSEENCFGNKVVWKTDEGLHREILLIEKKTP